MSNITLKDRIDLYNQESFEAISDFDLRKEIINQIIQAVMYYGSVTVPQKGIDLYINSKGDLVIEPRRGVSDYEF